MSSTRFLTRFAACFLSFTLLLCVSAAHANPRAARRRPRAARKSPRAAQEPPVPTMESLEADIVSIEEALNAPDAAATSASLLPRISTIVDGLCAHEEYKQALGLIETATKSIKNAPSSKPDGPEQDSAAFYLLALEGDRAKILGAQGEYAKAIDTLGDACRELKRRFGLENEVAGLYIGQFLNQVIALRVSERGGDPDKGIFRYTVPTTSKEEVVIGFDYGRSLGRLRNIQVLPPTPPPGDEPVTKEFVIRAADGAPITVKATWDKGDERSLQDIRILPPDLSKSDPKKPEFEQDFILKAKEGHDVRFRCSYKSGQLVNQNFEEVTPLYTGPPLQQDPLAQEILAANP